MKDRERETAVFSDQLISGLMRRRLLIPAFHLMLFVTLLYGCVRREREKESTRRASNWVAPAAYAPMREPARCDTRRSPMQPPTLPGRATVPIESAWTLIDAVDAVRRQARG